MQPSPLTARKPPQRWDIFCRVIDNFGDIGVCWRLARQLATEHGLTVRLWVDELNSLRPLQPEVQIDLASQQVDGVEICAWDSPFPETVAAEVVVEAFACELPENYLQAMATAPRPPAWINLEYLSAEPWVESCHRVASPHPALPLIKYFFFPGFSAKTAGLLAEAGLLEERDRMQQNSAPHDALQISLFCYEDAPLAALLDTWQASAQAIHCRVAAGKPTLALEKLLGRPGPWQVGAARLTPIPFLTQTDYDRLLWECDLNFVRGEDSFSRAQWAARPFVWQPYVQEDGAHHDKLNAFLDRYTKALPEPARQAAVTMFRAWNGEGSVTTAWPAFASVLPQLAAHNSAWAKELQGLGNLAENLVKFCTYEI